MTTAPPRKTIGSDYLRNNTASTLDEVRFYGQTFLVTRGGVPVGVMTPATDGNVQGVEVNSQRLRTHTGWIMDQLQRGTPVTITRHRNRHPVAVIIPVA